MNEPNNPKQVSKEEVDYREVGFIKQRFHLTNG